MGSQQQPIVVDSLSSSPQTGVWVAASTVYISAAQSWKNGDVVYAVVTNISNRTVSSIAHSGVGLGAWAVVTDGSQTAITSSTTVLECELWAATATADGSGIVTATLSGAGAAGTEILTFALVGTQALADKVTIANTAAAVVAIPAATSVFGSVQVMTIFAGKNVNNTPTAQTAYTLLGNTAVNGTALTSATLANAYTVTAGTAVTPPVTTATQSSGAPSVAITIMLRSPVPPPTAVTATYTAGTGISLAWTAPGGGYTGTGYHVYRSTAVVGDNDIYERLDSNPDQPVPWGTVTFIDRMQGYSPVQSGANICTYYITTVNGYTSESPASITATATWLG